MDYQHWYFQVDGVTRGPVTLEGMRREIAERRVGVNTPVAPVGSSEWTPLVQWAATLGAIPRPDGWMDLHPQTLAAPSPGGPGPGAGLPWADPAGPQAFTPPFASNMNAPMTAWPRGDQVTDAPPETYLLQTILVALFCCQPLGIFGIIYAARVESLWRQGNFAESRDASAKARKFANWGVLSWFVMMGFYLIAMIFAGLLG